MDCNRIEELLPWLVNGSLPEPETSFVKEHLARCAKCKQSLNETKFMLTATQTHVPIEILIDYASERALKSYDPILFEKHLAVCDECSEQLKLASESFDSIETAKVISFAEAKEKRKAAVVVPVSATSLFWKYAAIAACLLFMFTLGYLIYSLQAMRNLQSEQIAQTERINTLENETKRKGEEYSKNQNESQKEIENLKNKVAEKEKEIAEKERELERKSQTSSQQITQSKNNQQAQANVVAMDVFPSSVSRSDSENRNVLVIPRNAQSVTMILNSQSSSGASRYAIELADSSGRIVWRNNNMRRYSSNDFTINIAAQMIRTGNYIINIFSLDKGQKTKIETYQIAFRKN
jgi:flagellar biosynthesis GTPase FlhF